jgi:hypothetical protein
MVGLYSKEEVRLEVRSLCLKLMTIFDNTQAIKMYREESQAV